MAADDTHLSPKWFHAGIGREEVRSFAILRSSPVGAFLIRHSSQPGCFSLDIVIAAGIVPVLMTIDHDGSLVTYQSVDLAWPAERFRNFAELRAKHSAELAHPVAQIRAVAAPEAKLEAEPKRGVRNEGEEEDGVLMASAVFDISEGAAINRSLRLPTGTRDGREGDEDDNMLMHSASAPPGGRLE